MKSLSKTSMFVLALLLSAPSAAWALGPRQTLERFDQKARALLKEDPVAHKAEVARLVSGILDYAELAKASLGKHWDERSSAEQAEFEDIFRKLIEKSYVSRLKDRVDYQVTYTEEEKVSSETVKICTVLSFGKPPRVSETEIVYVMQRKGKNWLIVDVITDEVSLTRNYRSQFGKIIDEKGYPELLRKMKEKIEKEP